ncbi:MAG: hypothetical protein QG588_1806, partial [Candidatus Poribacteria bacterium]|nr:hypothetical protein [Candidatus Poribacteria bacterium]
MWNWDVRNIQ